MNPTTPTPQTPSADEYAIVATFSDESLRLLVSIQTQLHEILGDTIWLTPQEALHSTLMEIICDTEYKAASRSQLFHAWHEQYNQIVVETIAGLKPFDVTFNQLELSPRAIIAKSSDSQNFNAIRAALLSKINLPGETKLPPDITHCTLARYNKTLDLDTITKQTRAITINLTARISCYKLLKDLGPPTFSPKTIQTYMFRR